MRTDRLITVADPNPLIAQARAIVRGERAPGHLLLSPTREHLAAVLERLDQFKAALDERDVLIAELLDARIDAHKHAAVEALAVVWPRSARDDAEAALTGGMGDVK